MEGLRKLILHEHFETFKFLVFKIIHNKTIFPTSDPKAALKHVPIILCLNVDRQLC